MTSTTEPCSIWSRSEHNDMLKNGTCLINDTRDQNGKRYIYIVKRYSHLPGYGTASMRDIMEKSFLIDLKVYNQAAWKSHMFHVLMGMQPIDRKISLVEVYFGKTGNNLLQNCSSLLDKLRDNLDLSSSEQNNLKQLKVILHFINTNEYDPLKASEITDKIVGESQEKFNEFLSRQGSYIQDQFIPDLLELLKNQKDSPRIDTSSLLSVDMKMSKIGTQRWKSAIDNDQHFVPFKRFEHLHKFMNDDQITQLNEVMDYREKLFPSKIKQSAN